MSTSSSRRKRCTRPNCDRPSVGRADHPGLWGRHLTQARAADPEWPRCAVSDCEKPEHSRGWCCLHLNRWRRTGDPLVTLTPRRYSGPESPAWRGDDVDYRGGHVRAERERGPAVAHPCADCGRRSEAVPGRRVMDWSLKRDAAQRRVSVTTGLAFSPDPSDYEPRCRKCHAWSDRYDRTGEFPRVVLVGGFILGELEAAGGRLPAREMYERARALGIDDGTLHAARTRLGTCSPTVASGGYRTLPK